MYGTVDKSQTFHKEHLDSNTHGNTATVDGRAHRQMTVPVPFAGLPLIAVIMTACTGAGAGVDSPHERSRHVTVPLCKTGADLARSTASAFGWSVPTGAS